MPDPISNDPALAAATRRRIPLTLGLAAALATALAAPVAGWLLRDREVATLLGLIGGAGAVAAIGLAGTWLIDGVRVRLAQALDTRAKARGAPLPAGAVQPLLTGQGTDPDLLVAGESRRLAVTAAWIQPVAALPLAAIAIGAPLLLRPMTATDLAQANVGELAVAVTAIVVAFPLLILERRLHGGDRERFREGRPLARLLRLAVWTLVAGGGAAAARALDVESALWAQWLLVALIAGTGAELALRALALPFLPVTRTTEATGLGDSVITGLLLSRGGAGSGFGHGLKERFGIDLSRSWAVRFLRRTALPLLGLLALIGWLLSGVTVLSPNERGVYERGGAPLGVLAPGLHLHLPWPFGRVVRVEYGPVHELPLGGEMPAALAQVATDADTPAGFDRLWDLTHPTDSSYLVPSAAVAGGIGYQLLNADVRILWRVGLSDAAALDHAYRVAVPADLLGGHARRLFQRAVAARDLAGLLGADRERLATDLQSGLQAALDADHAGIEVTAVVIDAIHPPSGAVPSWHGVQAAEIVAKTDIARARGAAASTVADAQREAAARLAKGQAVAGEAVATAKADVIRFDADRQAFDAAPAAMHLERWLQATGRALAQANLTIIDHRLPIEGGSTIDLRKQSNE